MISGRRVSLAISGALFAITIAAFIRPPLLPEMGREFGLGSLGLGALGSAFALGRLAADVPAGRMSDGIAPGPMMITSGAMVTVGSVALALSPTVPLVFAAVFLLGVGSAWTLTTGQAFFATAPRDSRGAAMSIFAAALLTGQAIGPVVGGAIGSAEGWRAAIGAGAVIAVLATLPLFRMKTQRPASRVDPATASEDPSPPKQIALAFIYLLPAVQFTIGAAMIQTLVPIVADENLGLTVGVVGALLGIGGIARLVAAISAGWVMDRIGRRAALLPGLALQFSGLVVFALFGSLTALWVSVVLVSLGSVTVNVGTTLLADLSEGGRLGPRLGAFRFTGDAAFLVAPVLAGWLLDLGGRLVATLPSIALTLFVLVGSALVIPETRAR